jgi:hypothetical protein
VHVEPLLCCFFQFGRQNILKRSRNLQFCLKFKSTEYNEKISDSRVRTMCLMKHFRSFLDTCSSLWSKISSASREWKEIHWCQSVTFLRNKLCYLWKRKQIYEWQQSCNVILILLFIHFLPSAFSGLKVSLPSAFIEIFVFLRMEPMEFLKKYHMIVCVIKVIII